MKKALLTPLIIALCACYSDSVATETERTHSDRQDIIRTSYRTVRAYVYEVDTVTWFGQCADFSGKTTYKFEIFDEINEGDNIRAVICDNGTPLLQEDDYVTQVYYGW